MLCKAVMSILLLILILSRGLMLWVCYILVALCYTTTHLWVPLSLKMKLIFNDM